MIRKELGNFWDLGGGKNDPIKHRLILKNKLYICTHQTEFMYLYSCNFFEQCVVNQWYGKP